MIRRLDGLTALLVATIFATFVLFSCAAKQAPIEVTVRVPVNYSGDLSLEPCFSKAPAEVILESKGTARTPACPKPGETVTLIVIRPGTPTSYRISPEQVIIQRAGDGLPVAIKAHVPEQ
jgi:hypothetical protein